MGLIGSSELHRVVPETAKFLCAIAYIVGNATRVPGYPKTRVNPPVFKPVNPGLCAGENPGLTGLILGVSTHRMLIIGLQLVYVLIFAVNPPYIGIL